MSVSFNRIRKEGLYDPAFEHDNCGIGAIIDIEGRKSHQLVCDALSIVEHLEHRAGKDAEGKTGDGVGILTQIPHALFSKVMRQQGTELPARDNTVSACSFSRERISRGDRRGPCLKSSQRKRALPFSDGGMSLRIRLYSGVRRGSACRRSVRSLLKGPRK